MAMDKLRADDSESDDDFEEVEYLNVAEMQKNSKKDETQVSKSNCCIIL